MEDIKNGVEIEIAKDFSFGILDKDGFKIIGTSRHWNPVTVWWVQDGTTKLVTEPLTDRGDVITYKVDDNYKKLLKPFDEKTFIEQGLIRIKL